MSLDSKGLEYEVYWTKCETDEDTPDAYIPGLAQNKFKPWQVDEIRAKSTTKAKSRQQRMKSKEDLRVKEEKKPSLKDLRPEDKTRIANLIRELAKTGREKDNATNELESERKKYEHREKASKEQLELVAEERDTVKQHYIECQRLLAQYQNQLREEQEKVAEAILKANKQEMITQAAQKMAEQKAVWAAQMAAEEKLALLSKERSPVEQGNELQEEDKWSTDAQRKVYALQRSLNSRQPTHQYMSKQSHYIQQPSIVTGSPARGLHPDDPLEVQFYPALTSTNRSQHALSQNAQSLKIPKTLIHQDHPRHSKDEQWSVNEVADPRRSAEVFHVLEPQIDETPPIFEDEITPMSPVERQEYNDIAPQYRQFYERMTPEQRWNELILHREKLHQEQDWLRKKLQEKENLLQQRQVEKTYKHVTQHPLDPVHLLREEPEWQSKVQMARPLLHDYNPEDFDKVSNSKRLMQNIRTREPSDEGPRTPRVKSRTDQQHDRTLYREPTHNQSTLGLKERTLQNRIHLTPHQENHVRRGKEHPHMPSSKVSVSMTDKGCSSLYVDRETQTLSKEKSAHNKVSSEKRVLDVSHGRKDVGRYMENTSLLKDIVDTVESTHMSRFDPPLIQRKPVPAQQNQLLVQRDPPPIQRKITSPMGMDLSRSMFPSPDLFDISCDEENDKIEESKILQDIFFLT